MKYWDIIDEIERRARRLRAVSIGALLLFAAAFTALLATLVLRFLVGLGGLPPFFVVLLAAVPILVGAIAYVILTRQSPSLAPLLLRIDFALDLGARLSSLHEVAKTSPGSYVFRRLEAEVGPRLAAWRKALPVTRRFVAAGTMGAACIVMTILLNTALLGGNAHPDSSDLPADASISETSPVTVLDEIDENRPAETPGGSAPGGDETESEGARDYRLDDVLAELRLEAAAAGGGDPAHDAIEFDNDAEDHSLEELIAQLRTRLRSDQSDLTVEEQESLREAAASSSAPVQRALEDVLAASTPAEAQDAIETLAAAVELSRTFPQREAEGTSRVSTDQEPTEDPSPLPGTATLALPEDDSEGGLPQSGDDIAAEDEATERADEEQSETAEAGDEGPPVPIDVEPGSLQPAGFVLERPPSTVGEEGEVKSFLTAGVPLEFETDDEDATGARVSFDRIESIAASRDLPVDVVEMVRNYFESITEGGT